ncbi:hypothetical protein TB2_031331 [Malus domestica]
MLVPSFQKANHSMAVTRVQVIEFVADEDFISTLAEDFLVRSLHLFMVPSGAAKAQSPVSEKGHYASGCYRRHANHSSHSPSVASNHAIYVGRLGILLSFLIGFHNDDYTKQRKVPPLTIIECYECHCNDCTLLLQDC